VSGAWTFLASTSSCGGTGRISSLRDGLHSPWLRITVYITSKAGRCYNRVRRRQVNDACQSRRHYNFATIWFRHVARMGARMIELQDVAMSYSLEQSQLQVLDGVCLSFALFSSEHERRALR
jgi:hypothetical protein